MLEVIKYVATKDITEAKKRVAVYARVSHDSENASHSYDNQIEFYTDKVLNNPDWELAGVYADLGISGHSNKRPEFKRLMEDCRLGKIDMIITKTISRFARNTITLLNTVHELRELHIPILFDNDNINTETPDGEFMITILAAFAEQEAVSTSGNYRWAIEKKYTKGQVIHCQQFGYRKEGEEIKILEDEAIIVRQIFEGYLAGLGIYRIARNLNDQKILKRNGRMWTGIDIKYMLSNEFYAGDFLAWKKVSDYRTEKQFKNAGGKYHPQYYFKDHHAPIIDRETFERVQERMSIVNPGAAGTRQKQACSPFKSMITCGQCGKHYIHNVHFGKNGANYGAHWDCGTKKKYGAKYCHSDCIVEKDLISATKRLLKIKDVTRDELKRRVKNIEVIDKRHLLFHLETGEIVNVTLRTPRRRKKGAN